jgi:hypothetical protein
MRVAASSASSTSIGHQVQEGDVGAKPERRQVELLVGDETGVLGPAAAFEVDPVQRRMRRAREPFEPAEARERHARLAVLRTRERVAGRQTVVHGLPCNRRPGRAD